MDYITLRERFLAAARQAANDKSYNQQLRGYIIDFAEAVANSTQITKAQIDTIVAQRSASLNSSEDLQERNVIERAGKILKGCIPQPVEA